MDILHLPAPCRNVPVTFTLDGMDTLFHYCSVESFFAILSSKQLWLADAAHMNDSHEIRWADRTLARVIEANAKSFPSGAVDDLRTGYQLNRPHPFMFCLSEEPDILSQWRGYAADGTGVAIGLRTSSLPRRHHLPHTNAAPAMNTGLWEVVYAEEEQFQAMSAIFAALTAPKASEEMNYQVVGAQLAGLSPLLKNPAFHQEKEWRLLHTPMLLRDAQNTATTFGSTFKIKQRASGQDIYTYFEYPFPNELDGFVSEVWLGPKCRLSSFDLDLFFALNGYGNVPVKRSSATYR